jgi:hypothetical protein
MLKVKLALALFLVALMVFPAIMVIKARLGRARRDEAPPPPPSPGA